MLKFTGLIGLAAAVAVAFVIWAESLNAHASVSSLTGATLALNDAIPFLVAIVVVVILFGFCYYAWTRMF
jgi:hypothetical protein